MSSKFGSTIPPNWQLAFLPVDSREGRNYLLEMEYCVDFAYMNRKLMMEQVKEGLLMLAAPVHFGEFINIAHNYASLETHFHKKVLVHRKGATRAEAGEIGIIPGSQGTPSYLVRGRGNVQSFRSCSHGAGRKMGRKQAQRSLDQADRIKLYQEAEQILVEKVPILPLFHTSVRLLVKPWVTKFPTTGLREWYFKDVRIKAHP